MKKIVTIVLIALLSACASVTKMEGDQLVNNRMVVKVGDAWNKVSVPALNQPYDLWTQEGIALDQLRLWAGIRSGDPLLKGSGYVPAGQTAPRVPTFTAGMAPDQLVSLFESVYSRDGSLVKITKVEVATFAGSKGVRFEFSVTRKSDDVQMRGTAWAAIKDNELFAAAFTAPEMSFYKRLLPLAEDIAKSAQIRKL